MPVGAGDGVVRSCVPPQAAVTAARIITSPICLAFRMCPLQVRGRPTSSPGSAAGETPGAPIRDCRLPYDHRMARIRLLFILNGAAVAAFGPFASVILEGRGFAPAQIGLISAITSVAFVLSVSGWGHLGDVVLGRARALRVAILGAAALLAVFTLPLPLGLVALVYVGYAACNGAVGPLSDALAVNALRDPGRQYGKVRAFASGSFTVCAVVFGLLYGLVGYWPAGIVFVAIAIAIAVLAGRLPDLGRATLQRAAARRRGARGARDPAGPAQDDGRRGPRVRRRVRRVHLPVVADRRAGRRIAGGRALVGGRGGGRGRRDGPRQPARAGRRAAGAVHRRIAALHHRVRPVGGAGLAGGDHRVEADLGRRLLGAVDRERHGDPDAAPVAPPGQRPGPHLHDDRRHRRVHRERGGRACSTQAPVRPCCSGRARCSASPARSPAG